MSHQKSKQSGKQTDEQGQRSKPQGRPNRSVPALLEITKLSLMIFEELDIFRYIGK